MCQEVSIFQNKVGLRINDFRKQQNLSFQELAYRSEIEKSNLIKIVNNSKNPTIETIFKIAMGLDIKAKELFCFCNECQICCLEKS